METDPLLKRLHSIVQHQEELLHKQNTTEDWHFVAIVIDRSGIWLTFIFAKVFTKICHAVTWCTLFKKSLIPFIYAILKYSFKLSSRVQ